MPAGQIWDYGWKGGDCAGVARVVCAHGGYYFIVCGDATGEIQARAKKSVFGRGAERPQTGDFVRYVHNPSGESLITGILPRFSHFERRDPGARRKTQTLAVNFDVLAIAMAPGGDYSPARIERYLALAADMGEAKAVVVLTKADLAPEWRAGPPAGLLEAVAGRAEVFCTSAKTGEGIERLKTYAAPRTTLALVGSSGAGKSTLLNTLAGEELAAVQDVQEWSGRGRHTTTSRRLYLLPCGAMVVDTPGVREIGMAGEEDAQLAKGASTHRWRIKQ